MAKKDTKRPPHNEKTMKAFELIDKGYSLEDAHKLATDIDNPHSNSLYDLKKKYDKYLLSQEKTVKLASKVYLETMKMKPVETKEVKTCPECNGKSKDPDKAMCDTCKDSGIVRTLLYPSHTNRLAAADAVMDRIDPIVKKSISLKTNLNFTDVSLENFG